MEYELRKCVGCDEYVPMQYDDFCDDCAAEVDKEDKD